jgi:predicted nucleotidyltransferase
MITVAQLNLPDRIRQVLDDIVGAARRAFGDDLRSIVLYGSAAEGRLRATSDVNVMFVLGRFDESKANDFREPFRFACAAADVNAMFVLDKELELAAREFAQRFADMQRRHVMLFGDDPIATLSISREALVRRLQQTLLNLTIRLREMYIQRSLREEQCAATIADATGPLRAAAASILELEGRGTLAPKEALYTFVHDLGPSDFIDLLPHLSEAREKRVLPPGRAPDLLYTMVELASVLHQRAMALRIKEG